MWKRLCLLLSVATSVFAVMFLPQTAWADTTTPTGTPTVTVSDTGTPTPSDTSTATASASPSSSVTPSSPAPTDTSSSTAGSGWSSFSGDELHDFVWALVVGMALLCFFGAVALGISMRGASRG